MRFPEFTEPWETAKLGEVVEFCNERISTSELSIDNYVSTENLLQDFQGVLPANSIPADTNVISYKEGDILISNIRPYLRKVWKADNRGGCSTDVFVLRTKKSNCNSSFINYQIANDRFITYVMSGAKGVKMPRGDKKQMEKYSLSYPSFEEQDKIAHLLALLEQRIALQNGLINKLESLIGGIGQRVFSQFNSFVKLGNVAKITNGNSDVQDAIEIYESGLYPFYDRSDVIKYLNTYYLDKEAIIYAGEGSEFFPRYHNGKFALHQRCYAIFDFKEEYLTKFIYYYMFTLNGYFVRNSVGSTVPSLRMGTFEKVNIPKVPVKQQLYVIKVFDCLHKKLNQAKQTKRLFEMQKQYLLQQILLLFAIQREQFFSTLFLH